LKKVLSCHYIREETQKKEIIEEYRYCVQRTNAEILRIKLKEVGKKNIIPETTGFRKGNIFVQSSDSKEQVETKSWEKKVYALFADLKTAFDRVEVHYGSY